MQLHQDASAAGFVVRRVEADAIVVNEHRLEHSFIVHPAGLIRGWDATCARSLSPGQLDDALALAPEVVLLGTGTRQVFPGHAVLAACLTRGIGIEVMDNAAAARTYNVLAAEGRRVVAAFVLPG
jgi:uncharacterized protein